MGNVAIYERFIGEEIYTKQEHGSRRVRLKKKGEKVVFEMGEEEYDSAYQFFSSLYGKKTRISFQQYFSWADAPQPVFDPIAELHNVSTAHLGIDLENRSHEVKKLFYAGFGKQCYAAGYDLEDVLQEVYRGILARNKGICPFDPEKSSFGHYVHMVTGCIVANYHRKMNKLKEREQVGLYDYDQDGVKKLMDVSELAVERYEKTPDQYTFERLAEESLTSFIERSWSPLVPVLKKLLLGKNRKEIANELQMETADVSWSIRKIRELTLIWKKN